VDERGDDDRFREAARAWLADHAGPFVGLGAGAVFADADAVAAGHVARGRAWQRELVEGGWAGLGWPVEHGGRDLPVAQRLIWAREVAAAGVAAGINLIGEAMVGPTLMVHGTEAQRERFLPPMLRADEIWCQLFSEPDAGTDLASVTTTASVAGAGGGEGGGWIVGGHKIWTSAAHYADWGLLLARTDWDIPKHEGCTCFLVDMRSPGVTVRPVRQMTGGSAFDEVFLDGVRVPDSARVGPVGGGWAVAVTALGAERLGLGLGGARVGGGVERVLSELRTRGVVDDPVVRQLAVQVWIDARVVEAMGERLVAAAAAGGGGSTSGAEAAVVRLASIRLSRRGDELLDAVRGAGAMLVDEWTPIQLWIPATRIGGGTEEALRSVIAERVLGLPKAPRPDAGVPFRDLAEPPSSRTGDTSGRQDPQIRHQFDEEGTPR
jgi:alkylation response protein AidB-like acyl-CoA dehydrogenase